MKTLEEIKKAMVMCQEEIECDECPYCDGGCVNERLLTDALEYIDALEKEKSSNTITVRDILRNVLKGTHLEIRR